MVENKNAARPTSRQHLRRTNSRLSNNPYLLTADRAHVGSRLASLTMTPQLNERRLLNTESTMSVDLSLEDVAASAANGSDSTGGLRNLFATLRTPSRSTRAGRKDSGSRQEMEMSDMGAGQHLLHNGAGRSHPSAPLRNNSTSAPRVKPFRRQMSNSPPGVEAGATNGTSEVPDLISSTLPSELTGRAPAGAMCTSAVDADLASSPAGPPEYSTALLRRSNPPQHHMYASAHASSRHSSQQAVNDGLPNTNNGLNHALTPQSTGSAFDASQALYNRIYHIRKLFIRLLYLFGVHESCIHCTVFIT